MSCYYTLMCGRYYTDMSPELRPIIEEAAQSPLSSVISHKLAKKMKAEGEVCPGDSAAVIALNRNGEKKSFPMVWGYSAGKSRLIINARVETASEKNMFYDSWYRHRCVIPATAYIEWRRFHQEKKNAEKERYRICPEKDMTWLCGLYRMEDGIPHFVILTRNPGEEISFIHDRMPMIISGNDIDAWIDPKTDPSEIAGRAVTKMMFEKE